MTKGWRVLLYQMVMNIMYHMVKGANHCLAGQDIFVKIRENSPPGLVVANFTILGDPRPNLIRLCLTGEDADWFYLEGTTIRLNASSARMLDHEEHGSILMAALKCYEDEILQREYRVMIEVLNENDNKPMFLKGNTLSFDISELTSVNTVAFSVQALDTDDDTLMYIIDRSMPDANYFRIDLPNRGTVMLDKPLDYETKTQLHIVICAMEMNTKEKYSATAAVTVNVLDGDDQYPQFEPCAVLSQEKEQAICANPVYTANITEMEQDRVLTFSPGPIHAVDGDKGIQTPLSYSILSGSDNGRFRINGVTGDVVLTKPVKNRLVTPTLRLRIMASQIDDPRKYSVATALIRVLAKNRFPPQFNKTVYMGFVTEDSSPAALVSTYGNTVLVIQATDNDFKDGVNPKMNYFLQQSVNSTALFHITQEGLLVAKANELSAFESHFLQVLAIDQESGDMANASVDVKVLPKGEQVPLRPFGEERLYDLRMNVNAVGGIVGLALVLLLAVCFGFLQLARCRRQSLTARGSGPQGIHPNTSTSGRPMPLLEEVSYHNEAFGGYDAPSTVLYEQQGVYTKKEDVPLIRSYNRDYRHPEMPNMVAPVYVIPEPPSRSASSLILYNGKTPNRSMVKSISFMDGSVLQVNETADCVHHDTEGRWRERRESQLSRAASLTGERPRAPAKQAQPPSTAPATCEPGVSTWIMDDHHVRGRRGPAKPVNSNTVSVAHSAKQMDIEDDDDDASGDTDEDDRRKMKNSYKVIYMSRNVDHEYQEHGVPGR